MALELFVFIDALGWELLQRHPGFLAELPTRARLRSVFGYSCTCDPVILTGATPVQTGHFSFFRYAPESSPFGWLYWLSLLPEALSGRQRVRHRLSRWLAGKLGYTGYFQLYNLPFRLLPQLTYSETRDLYQPGGINSGLPTVMDHWRGGKIPFHCSDWRRADGENLRRAEAALEQGPPRAIYLYLAELDGLMHRLGTRHRAVEARLGQLGEALLRLWRRARQCDPTAQMHVFSDHGMADVERLLPLERSLEQSGCKQGRDYLAVLDSTMARFWFLTPGSRQAVQTALSSGPGAAGGRWVADEELEAWGCLFPGREYGEAFYLVEQGTLICPSHMGRRPCAGMHGYSPEASSSDASFLSTLDGLSPPRGISDLHAFMLSRTPILAGTGG